MPANATFEPAQAEALARQITPGHRRLSQAVRALAALGALCLMVVPALFWLSPEWVAAVGPSLPGMMGQAVTVDARALALGALASLPGIAVALWMLWQVWQLFGQYLQGKVFGRQALQHLRSFAWALLCTALLAPVQRTAVSLALTIGNPPGQRLLVFTVEWQDYLLVLVAAVMLVIATVMAEAVRLAEENDAFV
jgi:hypothetical protein